jgi:transposase InsO family protein
VISRRGRPEVIVSDHGTEFTSNAMLAWTEEAGVAWHFIAPGKPMQNGICEAFNSKSRPRPIRPRPMGRRLQSDAPSLSPRLPDAGSLRRETHRNGRSAPHT